MDKKDVLYPVNNAFREHVSLDGLWYFAFETADSSGWEHGIPKEDMVPVPSNTKDIFKGFEEEYKVGHLWYEKEFFTPKDWLGKDVLLRFDGVAYRCRVFVNGYEVALIEDGSSPSIVDVTKNVQYGQKNIVTVQVHNGLNSSTIPRGRMYKLGNGEVRNLTAKAQEPMASGLIKSVHIMALPQVRLVEYSLSTRIDEFQKGEIAIQAIVKGNCIVTATLRDRKGAVVATSVGSKSTLSVDSPHLWNIYDGYVYTLEFEVSRLGKESDAYSVPVGIRDFAFMQGRLLLNQKPLYIKGKGSLKEELKISQGANLVALKNTLKSLKEGGFNMLLSSPYAISEKALQLIELEGFLVMQEIYLLSEHMQSFYKKRYFAQEEESFISIIPKEVIYSFKGTKKPFCWTFSMPRLSEDEEKRKAYKDQLLKELKESIQKGHSFALQVYLEDIPIDIDVLRSVQAVFIRGLDAYKGHEQDGGATVFEKLEERLLEIQQLSPTCPVFVSFSGLLRPLEGQTVAYKRTEQQLSGAIQKASHVKGVIL